MDANPVEPDPDEADVMTANEWSQLMEVVYSEDRDQCAQVSVKLSKVRRRVGG